MALATLGWLWGLWDSTGYSGTALGTLEQHWLLWGLLDDSGDSGLTLTALMTVHSGKTLTTPGRPWDDSDDSGTTLRQLRQLWDDSNNSDDSGTILTTLGRLCAYSDDSGIVQNPIFKWGFSK